MPMGDKEPPMKETSMKVVPLEVTPVAAPAAGTVEVDANTPF